MVERHQGYQLVGSSVNFVVDDGHVELALGRQRGVQQRVQEALIPDVDWKRPDDVISRQIDPDSAQLATPYCPATRSEIFVAGTEPETVCQLHAGSGEPSPFWRDYDLPRPGEWETEEDRAEREKRARERETGIRRLLRRIFGGDN